MVAEIYRLQKVGELFVHTLFTKYIEISLRRALLETEREVHFLVERGVKETPIEIQEARDLNPVLRKDFVLQV